MNNASIMATQSDFIRAKKRAQQSRFFSRLTGRRDDMPCYEEVKHSVSMTGESYIGCKSVPVESIVGSENRSSDFNKAFCPRRAFLHYRWAKVDSAYYEGITLPPVKLLEIDGLFYVRDGNHRVSVAKHHKLGFLDAEVTKLNTRANSHVDVATRASESRRTPHEAA